ncbi:hypothetical protein Ahy_B01g055324 [Arachis hypogaea]|uniref:Ubiquitin-like protease family profile domain-containing protein n=1 Tax=Arachis hypogaea TaxID=3818 RepID=A0A445AVW3_ARAHY|nr:hypothetical protein Ahy_B01g055324 [Arachis hypogaea]
MLQNMAIGNHNGGDFLHAKNKKSFDIQDYKMFIHFLDLKELVSHPYIFAPVCNGKHCWIRLADVRKKKICIIDLYHKKCPSPNRLKLNKFVGYVISRMRVYAGGTFRKDDHEIELYDCAVYAEVDHFRIEYVSWILFHEMNQDRDTVIKESETIRLSKPSEVLLSPCCQIDSDGIDSD